MIIQILFCLLLIFANPSLAKEMVDYEFKPEVTIPAYPDENTIRIVGETDYQATYSKGNNFFEPIEMPFKVISKLPYDFKYKLVILSAEHSCTYKGEEATLEDVSVIFDKQDPRIEAIVPAKTDEQEGVKEHKLLVTFPITPQRRDEQTCNGEIRIELQVAGI